MTTLSVAPSTLLPERQELSPARRRLFGTALSLFARDGYNGISVRDIVRELNQQPTAIYAHVASKQELLFQLIKIGDEELCDRLRAALLETGNEPTEQVRALIETLVLTHLEFPDLARVSHRENRHLAEEQIEAILAVRMESGRMLTDVVERGIRLGVFNPPDVVITNRAIAAMGTHVVDWWTTGDALEREHIAKTQADLAIRMLI